MVDALTQRRGGVDIELLGSLHVEQKLLDQPRVPGVVLNEEQRDDRSG